MRSEEVHSMTRRITRSRSGRSRSCWWPPPSSRPGRSRLRPAGCRTSPARPGDLRPDGRDSVHRVGL